MDNMMNAKTMELNPEDFENVVGGGEALLPAFQQYAEYVDELYEKYGCRGKGIGFLKSVCTLEEKSEINELWEIVLSQSSDT